MARLKTKRLGRKKWPLILVIVIIAAGAGFVLYNKFSLATNKRSFQDARQAIDSVFYDAIKQVGPPDDAKISSSCSKTYKEFTGYTDLTCGVDTAFIYGVSNQIEANTIFKKVQDIISTKHKDLKPTRPLALSIKDSIVVSTTYHAATDTFMAHGLNCTVNYVYDTPREIDLKIKNKDKRPFEITLGCYGAAKQQYYRLAS